MSCKHTLLATAALIVIPSWLLASDFGQPTAEPDSQQQAGESLLFPHRQFGSTDALSFVARGQSSYYYPQTALRFGWWGVSTDGSENKTGEWQGLDSSAFWDFDRLSSDGVSTLDISASGTEDESTDVGLYYFGPGYFGNGFSADIDYERFIHRLDHKPLVRTLDNPGLGDPVPADGRTGRVSNDDLDVGKDYAIRVQEFKADFKGRITDNLKWRLNLWGLRKRGERQASSHAHCHDDDASTTPENTCHIQSEQQRIDWTTVQIEPVIEARWGAVTAEYSRTMRAFNQDDEFVVRPYVRDRATDRILFSYLGGYDADHPDGYGYAIVPDNMTQIDRLKFGVDLTPCTDFYANLFHQDTENKFRDNHRRFYGFDMRLTNRSIEGLALSTYVKWNTEDTSLPKEFLGELDPAPDEGPPDNFDEVVSVPPFGEPLFNERAGTIDDAIMHLGGTGGLDARFPIDRRRTSAGIDARWRPGARKYSSCGLSVNTGYEYRELERTNVNYVVASGMTITQLNTFSHLFHIGTSRRWSPCFDTFIRYNLNFYRNPLTGVREHDDVEATTDVPSETVTNTLLPENENLIEIGGTWTPSYNFLVNATFGLQNLHHNSADAQFDETNYPLIFSAWYAPDDRWSFTGGYAYYTNFIDQDISVGFRDPGGSSRDPIYPAFTTPWNFQGRAQLVNLGARYRCSDTLQLVGDVEWVRGTNGFTPTDFPGDATAVASDLSAIPFFSDVIIETTKISAGVDYWWTNAISVYFRYNYFDYEDESIFGASDPSGTAHMFLGGVAATY